MEISDNSPVVNIFSRFLYSKLSNGSYILDKFTPEMKKKLLNFESQFTQKNVLDILASKNPGESLRIINGIILTLGGEALVSDKLSTYDAIRLDIKTKIRSIFFSKQ